MQRATNTLFGLFASALLVAGCSTPDDQPPSPCTGGSPCAEPRPDSGSTGANDAGTDAPRPDLPDAAVAPTRRVLFVGNSYTQVNDLPRVVRELGAETRTPFDTDAVLVGGATLADHWATTGARARIVSGGFDAVVLQGQSLEALGGEGGFETFAPRFGDEVKKAGSQAVWFATWARGPGADAYLRGEATANRIEQAYSKVALATGGKVARVGGAFHQAGVRLPGVALHAEDQSHPTPAGTLLAACTIVAALTGKAPRVPSPAPLGIPQDTAQALCAIGADVRCLEGGDLCDGLCFKLQSDRRHCGRCGNACATGDPCLVGRCGCPEGQTACSLACTDTRYDNVNCGACGKACEPGRSCSSGKCECRGVVFRQSATLSQLTALDSSCTELGTASCENAGKRHCVSLGCSTASFGPPSGRHPAVGDVACLPRPTPTAVPYAVLQTFDSRCDGLTERYGEGCIAAVSRYCQSLGAVSGIGHHEPTGTEVSVACLTNALALTVDRAVLQGHVSRCTPHPITCGAAAWGFCESLGYAAGFGPVESSGNLRTVVCVGES